MMPSDWKLDLLATKSTLPSRSPYMTCLGRNTLVLEDISPRASVKHLDFWSFLKHFGDPHFLFRVLWRDPALAWGIPKSVWPHFISWFHLDILHTPVRNFSLIPNMHAKENWDLHFYNPGCRNNHVNKRFTLYTHTVPIELKRAFSQVIVYKIAALRGD